MQNLHTTSWSVGPLVSLGRVTDAWWESPAVLTAVRILERLARRLDIPPQLLGLAPLDIDPDWSVRRRDFLTRAASGAAAAMLTANGRGGTGRSDLLAFSGPAPHDSPTLAGLEKRIASAHAIYQRGEYQHVADGLSALIGCTTNGTVLAEDERSRH